MNSGSRSSGRLRQRLFDVALKLMNVGHRALLAITRGRKGWSIGRMPAVELHTTGRVSGIRRSTMLTSPVHGDGRWVLVASKGGDDRDPEWYRNLVVNPNVELTVNGHTRALRARTATPEEKAELWPRIVAVNPGYAGYQKKTERSIPVVICEPSGEPSAR
ncbi:MAG: nitroreductase family deazaflavin-dependent oxidoreductase [Salinibacterium sp.]|nr:nitroreductase family deazaflavin-dependent oxidoreductase [Micrococcales bacterium]MBX3079208.1 nitroreductase family deazaflavin-dependent oxidoreductase [Cryobacterium sp.]MCB1281855.1 nitroreductase family deazaflavin-dependent oxidoreductase [Salinibacterium sp.]